MVSFPFPFEDTENRWKWLLEKLGTKEMKILYQEAYAILNNKEDAYDVLYEALLKAFSKCGQLRDENKAFFWMVRIVRNEAYTYHRHFFMKTLWAQKKLLFAAPPRGESAEYLYIRAQENARLRAAIEKLKAPDKDTLFMHIYDNLGFPEIAEKLHMNYNTVRSQYQRILKKLKRALEEQQP